MVLLTTHSITHFLESSTPSESELLTAYGIPETDVKGTRTRVLDRSSLRESTKTALDLAMKLNLPTNSLSFRLNDIKVGVLGLSNQDTDNPKKVIRGRLASIHFSLTKKAIESLGNKYDGEYIIELDRIYRSIEKWSFGGRRIWWNSIPETLYKDNEAYLQEQCSKHGFVLSGLSAPEFNFFDLRNNTKYSSIGLKGKIVVLLFWHGDSVQSNSGFQNTLSSMAKFQEYFMNYPDWDDKVAFVGLNTTGGASNAEHQKIVASEYLLHNRLGSNIHFWYRFVGGKDSKLYSRFNQRYRFVPLMCVINADWKIARLGHPLTLNVPKIVSNLLDP